MIWIANRGHHAMVLLLAASMFGAGCSSSPPVGRQAAALDPEFPMETPVLLDDVGGSVLGAVRSSDSTTCVGAPWAVRVDTKDPAKTEVFINSTPGARRIMQFGGGEGEQTVAILARDATGAVESALVKVYVKECGLKLPRIATTLSHADTREMHFSIENHDDFSDATSFTWTLSDGTTATTPFATWTHRFDAARIDWEEHATAFVVSVRANRPSGSASAMRTFTARPTYALTRAHGVIQPPVSFDPLRWEDGLSIVNVEPSDVIHIETATSTLWFCDMSPPKELDPVAFAVDVPPGQTRHYTYEQLLGDRKGFDDDPNVCGVGVDLRGKSSGDIRVEAAAFVELREAPHRVQTVRDPAVLAMLRSATASGLWPTDQDTLTQRDVWRLGREGRLDVTTGELTPDELPGAWRPALDPFRCDPYDPTGTPPVPGLVCAPTERFEQSLPYVANAYAGDFALSANCGLIGELLRQLSPAQRFSHTGVFVQSQDRIRHSTAAEARIAAGAGASLNERNLRYPQPGVLTQSVAGAYAGEVWRDADGGTYELHSFSDEVAFCNGDADPTSPLLVRWTHEESDEPDVGSLVQWSRDIAGHYRFFAYSEGKIGMDPDYDDPLGLPGADGRNRATVCSSFLWTAAQEAGMTLEASCEDPAGCVDGIFEGRDRLGCDSDGFGLGCAERDENTADGLYLYTADERLAAGESIYSAIQSMAREGSRGWATFLGVPNRYGNQVSNCFATDECTGDDDGDDWQDAVDGHAVSPDDLLFWDRPYGATQPLIERQGLYRRIYSWQDPSAVGEGEALVKVVDLDGAAVAGASVDLLASVHLTDEDGVTLFAPVPAGTREVRAGRLIDGSYFEGTALVTIRPGERAEVEVVLGKAVPVEPGGLSADVLADITLDGIDHEAVRPNQRGYDTGTIAFSLTAGAPFKHESFSLCIDGEVRLEQHVTAVLQPDNSVLTTLDARLFEGTRCTPGPRSEQEDRVVEQRPLWSPDNTTWTWNARLYNDERRGGDIGYFTVDLSIATP